MTEPGEIVGPVEIGPIAHGGHCVARLEGRVLFVRHALPGEIVRVRLTDTSKKSMWRGDAIEVLDASSERVAAPCPVARPGGCGGCDFQHARVSYQRELKRRVVAEQLLRLAGIEWAGEVEDAGPADGLGWRTRQRYLVAEGDLAMRAHRSHTLVPIPDGCPLAHPEQPGVTPVGSEIRVVGRGAESAVLVDGDLASGKPVLTERADGRDYLVAADGFWQVHPKAADTLVADVLDGTKPVAGERGLDLYCGVGLFAGALAARGLRVTGVETSRQAVEFARQNVPQGRFHAARVNRYLRRDQGRYDVVVLDPPRAGAGRDVVRAVAAAEPRVVAYVACDPAALARDLATFAELGYQHDSIRAFDLFGMTHHVEGVAILTPRPGARMAG